MKKYWNPLNSSEKTTFVIAPLVMAASILYSLTDTIPEIVKRNLQGQESTISFDKFVSISQIPESTITIDTQTGRTKIKYKDNNEKKEAVIYLPLEGNFLAIRELLEKNDPKLTRSPDFINIYSALILQLTLTITAGIFLKDGPIKKLKNAKRTAFHEAGHAVVSHRLGQKISEISTVLQNDSSGRIIRTSEIDLSNPESITNEVAVLFAGVVSENIVAGHDIRNDGRAMGDYLDSFHLTIEHLINTIAEGQHAHTITTNAEVTLSFNNISIPMPITEKREIRSDKKSLQKTLQDKIQPLLDKGLEKCTQIVKENIPEIQALALEVQRRGTIKGHDNITTIIDNARPDNTLTSELG